MLDELRARVDALERRLAAPPAFAYGEHLAQRRRAIVELRSAGLSITKIANRLWLWRTLCLAFGGLGYLLAYAEGQLFREGLFQFMTSFSLPWYAIVGAQKGVEADIPVLGCILLAVIGPTAGRWLIDVSCGVTPKQFIRGEWFVSIAAFTGAVWIVATWAGAGTWLAAGIAFVLGFTIRVIALYRAWEEPLASEPKGVYQHSDGRPMLGRKLKGKSVREMHDLGLVVDDGDEGTHADPKLERSPRYRSTT